jgi:IstB-like ATP binding protein
MTHALRTANGRSLFGPWCAAQAQAWLSSHPKWLRDAVDHGRKTHILLMPPKRYNCRTLCSRTLILTFWADEVGYLGYRQDAANVLLHVVNHRYLKKRPMIFTTNKPLRAWGKVLHDEDLAAVILDRVLEGGRLIHLNGPSGGQVI